MNSDQDEHEQHVSGPHRGRGRGRGEGRGRGGGGRGGGPGRRGGRGRGGVGRGDVRIAALTLLTEEPMHGYQIMGQLSERSGGAWQPSPGSIYPLLQQLADEGLITANETDGRKVFSLTPSGEEAAAEHADQPPIWDRVAESVGGKDLREAVGSLIAATKQVGSAGTSEQRARAAEILDDTRKQLYQLLAD